MIDFEALVLGPAMATFARPITIIPLKSLGAGAAPYDARGVWTHRNIDVITDGGGVLGTAVLTVGVRLTEFGDKPRPVKGDRIQVPGHMSLPGEGTLEIDDVDPDGNGGAVWTLKRV